MWLAFIVALVAALLTALSYASLGSRHPRAAGAAYVTQRAYGFPLLSFMVGLALVCSGLTSIATQSQVFAANIAAFDTGIGSGSILFGPIIAKAGYAPAFALAAVAAIAAWPYFAWARRRFEAETGTEATVG